MDGLHRGDRAVAPEARDIDRIHDLHVFDPPAPVALVGQRHLLDRVEHFLVRGIADGMHRDLEAVERRAAHQIAQLRGREQRQAGVAGIVGVRPLQPGAARTERAVEVELHPAQPQPVIVEPGRRLRTGDQLHCRHTRGIGHDAHLQPAIVARPAIGLPVLDGSAHVGDCGNTLRNQQLLRLGQREVAIRCLGDGDEFLDQVGGAIDEHARGRLRPRDALDPAAGRIGGLRGHARGLERGGVGPAGMAIDPFEPDGAIGHRRVEVGGGGETPEPPFLLVPAAPDDPPAVGVGGGVFADQQLRFFQRDRVRQVERQGAEAEAHHVQVRIDQAGDHDLAFAIEQVVDLLGPPVAAFEHLAYAPAVVDPQPGEAHHLAVLVEGNALDVVDKLVGLGGRGGEADSKGEGAEKLLHGAGG